MATDLGDCRFTEQLLQVHFAALWAGRLFTRADQDLEIAAAGLAAVLEQWHGIWLEVDWNSSPRRGGIACEFGGLRSPPYNEV